MDILSLLLLGVIAGTVAGLLGVGGGIVIVPMLVWIFGQFPEIPAASLMHIAIGTSLATIVITSLSSIIAHQRHKAVQWFRGLSFLKKNLNLENRLATDTWCYYWGSTGSYLC